MRVRACGVLWAQCECAACLVGSFWVLAACLLIRLNLDTADLATTGGPTGLPTATPVPRSPARPPREENGTELRSTGAARCDLCEYMVHDTMVVEEHIGVLCGLHWATGAASVQA